ncbi:TatD family hydrolase [Aquimarina sp. U1-2]|uniref:TatD family hydrolase n=1 Tax=Aquimarina sp. U1-2 TaxID=2823141 RepID=UPI001AECA8D1|nr:TatD family hydrolase [Aquimarina sp. U1-2]MBP2832571.1 TatD family hydrolase [Aquimarina sp. U1-2]
MILTDTHTHIYSEAFDEDQDEMMQRAIANGVQRFFVPAIDASYTKAMYDIESRYPENVFLMMGLHPTHVKENYQEELAHVEAELQKRSDQHAKNFYAVGEIGIDLYWDTSTIGAQIEAFRYQIKLAKQHQLPIVIHCREAFKEIFEVLESEKGEDLYGIFHCFTGTLEDAHRAIGYNMKLGIGGVVTFKNGKIDQFLHQIPLEHVVVETDAPYLAPTPYRGKRNESAYLINILNRLAEIYKIPVSEIAAITTTNSKEIFDI